MAGFDPDKQNRLAIFITNDLSWIHLHLFISSVLAGKQGRINPFQSFCVCCSDF